MLSSHEPSYSRFDMVELPTDVLLTIVDHLKGPEAMSLSLTCKALYSLCFASALGKMTSRHRGRFLTLLERDAGFGRNVYYCHECDRLHPIDEAWKSTPFILGNIAPDCGMSKKGRHVQPASEDDAVDAVKMSFSHARLVLNEHLYGPGRGLPTSTLHFDVQQRCQDVTIQCTQQARIYNDELLLMRTFDFLMVNDEAIRWRDDSGSDNIRLCEHVVFFSPKCGFRDCIAQLQQPADDQVAFQTCRNSTSACGLCLMDYEVTIMRKPLQCTAQGSTAASSCWAVSVRVYHQVGSGRDPSDWKWARFADTARPSLFFPNRPNRRCSDYYAGTIRHHWNKGKPTPCQSSGASPGNRGTAQMFPTWLRGSKPLIKT